MNFIENTLVIRGLCFGYKNNIQILKGIDLTVPKGGIYGLLGSSGCGKTTLLRCALGRLVPRMGSISLFGERPGSKECRVPGPGVGYMPQEIALYDDFSIEETLVYFGRLFGIKAKIVDQRIEFLIDLLQLPDKDRLISKLSGGQKRRVSIATALLHNPPFLILDEPTVGVDLILREAIWKHLELLCANGLTVIVTTHYIEEAKNALRVGFMRSGRLLAEDCPEKLRQLHGLSTLEAVFLKLSQIDDKRMSESGSVTNLTVITEEANETHEEIIDNNNKTGIILKVIKPVENESEVQSSKWEVVSNNINGHTFHTKTAQMARRYSRKQSIANGLIQLRQERIITDTNFLFRLFALTLKNFKQMARNLPLLTFFVVLPSVEISLLITCIGRDINSIPVALFNPEKSFPLSEIFMDSIDKNRIEIIRYNTFDTALEAVQRNEVWAMIYFKPQFSQNFYGRLAYSSPSEEMLDKGSIHLKLDMSNQVIGSQIQKYVSDAFTTFVDKLKEKYETNLDKIKPMVKRDPPVYGQEDASFGTFVAPGALIVVAYFGTTVVTCHLLIRERTDGLVERSLVAGVKPLEFVISHIILQLFLLSLQVGLKLFIAFFVFSIENFGSLFWASALTWLQGTCGLMFGLMLSAICPDEIYATTLCIGAFFPTVIIGGILWPLESMPIGLRYVSQTLPSTLAIDSLRAILMRGWGVNELQVLLGFIITLLWLLFFLINALVFFIKKL